MNNGFINVADNLNSIYTIEVKDFKGNSILVTIPIEGKKLEILDPKNIEKTDDYIYADQRHFNNQRKIQHLYSSK